MVVVSRADRDARPSSSRPSTRWRTTPAAVEDCKVWLLKQKQTQDWKTTKRRPTPSTRCCCAAPMCWLGEAGRGGARRRAGARRRSRRGGRDSTSAASPRRRSRQSSRPYGQEVRCRRGVGQHPLQYFEDMSRIRPYAGTPAHFEEGVVRAGEPGAGGAALHAVTGPGPGRRRADREDRAAASTATWSTSTSRTTGQRRPEPTNVLSGPPVQDGLGYYEQTRDAASHFFHPLPAEGDLLVRVSARVQHRGRYQTGIAQVQCMYAPEFNSHSESLALDVR